MTTLDASITDKRRVFRQLHDAGCFVIPNPWDIGSARLLQGLGFKALATTSSGFGWSHGYPDNGATRDMALAHLPEIVAVQGLASLRLSVVKYRHRLRLHPARMRVEDRLGQTSRSTGERSA